jgi:GAF domain-containing protein
VLDWGCITEHNHVVEKELEHHMNSFTQQWRTADAISRAGLTVDDVWVRYFSIGGTADGIGIASYLHGLVMLDALQRDLITYSVDELLKFPLPDAEYHPDHQHGGRNAGTHQPGQWPILRVRLADMFDPREAEHRRLMSLQRTGLLTAGRGERFDRFTRRARDTLDMDTSIISMVTGPEQVMTSITGTLGSNLPREMSFCTYTIAQDQALVVPDATMDDRFNTNPLVTETPNLRFYAGHSLTGPGGWRIGALCLLDVRPRTFTRENRRTLETIANLVQAEILTH